MVWQKLSSKKLGDDVPSLTADFIDSFSQYTSQGAADANWVSTDTAVSVNISTDLIDWDFVDEDTDDSIYYDLWGDGIFPSDTNWTLRYKWIVDAVTQGASTVGIGGVIGLSDSTGSGEANQDAIVVKHFVSDASNLIQNNSENAGNPNTGNDGAYVRTNQTGTVYVELKRTSDVTYESTHYSDANYTQVIEKLRSACVAGIVNLRYIVIKNRNPAAGSEDHVLNGTMDDVKFYNNTEGLQSHITPKTVKTLDETPPTPLVSDDMSTDNWIKNDADPAVASGVAVFTYDEDGTNDAAIIDIGQALSNEKWMARFDLTWTALTGTGTAVPGIGLFSENETFASDDAQNCIFATFSEGSLDEVRCKDTLNAAPAPEAAGDALFAFLPVVGTKYYFEIVRLSTTTYEVRRYSDSNFKTIVDTAVGVCASNLTNLRYFKWIDRADSSGGASSTHEMSDLKIYNGITGLTTDLDDDFTYSSGKTPDFTEDFNATTGWTQTGTDLAIDADRGLLLMDAVNDTDDRITYDLQATEALNGNNLNDTNWTVRFKLSYQLITAGPDITRTQLAFILSATNGAPSTQTRDFIGFNHRRSSGAGVNTFGAIKADNGVVPDSSGTAFAEVPTIATPYFVEISRDGLDDASVRMFSDANYTDLLEEEVLDISGDTITALRYISISNRNFDGTADSFIQATIDDIKVYDGVSVSNTPIEETTDLTDNFSGTDDWDDTGTGGVLGVNVTTDVLDFDVPPSVTSLRGTQFDLGSAASQDAWTLRFKLNITTFTQGGNSTNHQLLWGLSDQGSTATLETVQDFIGAHITVDSATNDFRLKDADGLALNSAADDGTFVEDPTVGTWYVELKRTSQTTYEMSLYDDPDYTVLIEKLTAATANTVDGLQFIKFYIRNPAGVGDSDLTGIVDDVKFWDGIEPLTHQNIWESFRGVADGGSNNRHILVFPQLNKVDFDIVADSADDGIQQHLWTDLGASVSQENWTVRWDMIFSSITTNASLQWFFGMSDLDGTNDAGINRDGLWFQLIANTATTWALMDTNNTDVETEATSATTATPTLAIDTKYYCQLSRIDETTFIFNVYSDSNYSDILISLRATTVTTINNLRYFCILNETAGNGGNLVGTIDNFKFINNSTNIDGPCEGFDRLQIMATMLPSGTIDPNMRINGDASGTDATSGNYQTRYAINGGADNTTTYDNRTFALIAINTETTAQYSKVEIPSNSVGNELTFIAHGFSPLTPGEATAPNRSEGVGKWEGLEEVHTLSLFNNDSGDFDTDSEMVIFGEVKQTIGGEDNFDTVFEALT